MHFEKLVFEKMNLVSLQYLLHKHMAKNFYICSFQEHFSSYVTIFYPIKTGNDLETSNVVLSLERVSMSFQADQKSGVAEELSFASVSQLSPYQTG